MERGCRPALPCDKLPTFNPEGKPFVYSRVGGARPPSPQLWCACGAFKQIAPLRRRRPGPCWVAITALAGREGLALAARAQRLHRRRWSAAGRTASGRPALPRRFGDDAVIVLVRGDSLPPGPDLGPRAPARARGLIVGQPAAQDQAAPAATEVAVRGVRGDEARARSSTARARSSTRPWGRSRTSSRSASRRAEGGNRPTRRPSAARKLAGPHAGSRPRRSARPPRTPGQLVYAQFVRDSLQLGAPVRHPRGATPAAQRPQLRRLAELSTQAGRPGGPKARFAYLFPIERRRRSSRCG